MNRTRIPQLVSLLLALIAIAAFFLPYIRETETGKALSLYGYAKQYYSAGGPETLSRADGNFYTLLTGSVCGFAVLALLCALIRRPVLQFFFALMTGATFYVINWDFAVQQIMPANGKVWGIAHSMIYPAAAALMICAVWLYMAVYTAKQNGEVPAKPRMSKEELLHLASVVLAALAVAAFLLPCISRSGAPVTDAAGDEQVFASCSLTYDEMKTMSLYRFAKLFRQAGDEIFSNQEEKVFCVILTGSVGAFAMLALLCAWRKKPVLQLLTAFLTGGAFYMTNKETGLNRIAGTVGFDWGTASWIIYSLAAGIMLCAVLTIIQEFINRPKQDTDMWLYRIPVNRTRLVQLISVALAVIAIITFFFPYICETTAAKSLSLCDYTVLYMESGGELFGSRTAGVVNALLTGSVCCFALLALLCALDKDAVLMLILSAGMGTVFYIVNWDMIDRNIMPGLNRTWGIAHVMIYAEAAALVICSVWMYFAVRAEAADEAEEGAPAEDGAYEDESCEDVEESEEDESYDEESEEDGTGEDWEEESEEDESDEDVEESEEDGTGEDWEEESEEDEYYEDGQNPTGKTGFIDAGLEKLSAAAESIAGKLFDAGSRKKGG